MKKYPDWTLVDWDGNPALNYKCWRKSFHRGHVSVGVGEFKNIVFSHGPNSEESMSGTRWRSANELTEQEAMAEVDSMGGYYDSKKITRPTA